MSSIPAQQNNFWQKEYGNCLFLESFSGWLMEDFDRWLSQLKGGSEDHSTALQALYLQQTGGREPSAIICE